MASSSPLGWLALFALSSVIFQVVSAEVLTLPPFSIAGGYSITNSFTLCEQSYVTISACENAYSGDPLFYVYMDGVYQYTGDNYNNYYCPRVDNQVLTPPAGSCAEVVIYNYCVGSGSCSGTLTATIEPVVPRPSAVPTRQPTSSPLRYCPSYSASGRSAPTTCNIQVCQRSDLTVSTCSYRGGQYSGDTYLSLYRGSTFVASNDDDPNGGACSTITATVEPVNGQCTTYALLQACFQTYCTGTTAYSLTAATTPTALPTRSPTFGPSLPPTSYCSSYTATSRADTTSCTYQICQPASLTMSTCTADGGRYTGDTYLALYVNGFYATQNDDAVGGGSCSKISNYVVTPTTGQCSYVDVRQSCFSTSCSGRTVFKVNYNYAGSTRQPTVAPTQGPRLAAATVFRFDNVASYSLSESDQTLLNTAILRALQLQTYSSFSISDATYSVQTTTLLRRVAHWGARLLSAVGVGGSIAPATATLSLFYTVTLDMPATYCATSTAAATCASFLSTDLQSILAADSIDTYVTANAPYGSSLTTANSASVYVSSWRETSTSSSTTKKKSSSSGTTAVIASVCSVFGWVFFVFVIFAASAAARNRSRVNPSGDPFAAAAAAAYDPNKNVQMVAVNAPPSTAMPISDPYAVNSYATATASYPFASPTPMAFAMPQPGASTGAPSWPPMNTAPTAVGAGYGATSTADYYAAASVPMGPLTGGPAGSAPHAAASEPHSTSHHATTAATAPTVVPAPYVLPSTTFASSVAAFHPANYVPSSTTTSAALGGGGGGGVSVAVGGVSAGSSVTAPSASASSASVPTYATYPYPTVPSLTTAAASSATATSSYGSAAPAAYSSASYTPYTPYTPYTGGGAAHP